MYLQIKNSEDFEQVHNSYGYDTKNDEGKATLKFALAYNLVLTNTYF